jgi:outer membrane protein TolC
MTRGTLVLIVLGALAGCAGMKPATVDDARVARLPAEEKAALVAWQQRVTTAESNVDAAKVAVNEAKQFRDMAKSEVDAAQARFDAAQKALSLGAQTRSERTLVAGRDAAEAAQAELSAAQATLQVVRADLEWSKVQALERNRMADDVDRARFMRSHEEAQLNLADARHKVARLNGELEQARAAWDQRRRDVASTDRATLPPPPPAPEKLRLPAVEELK